VNARRRFKRSLLKRLHLDFLIPAPMRIFIYHVTVMAYDEEPELRRCFRRDGDELVLRIVRNVTGTLQDRQ
jgi:hypothetical protein